MQQQPTDISFLKRSLDFLHRVWRKYRNSRKRYQIGIPVCFVLLVWYVFCLPSPLFDVPYSTVVSDRRGELLGARIADDHQWRFPVSDSIPEKYSTCVIQFEDRYFRSHWGFNPVSILRAVKQNVMNERVVSGASTLTMQTIRLSRKEKRTFFEKFIEIILATRLEFACSKDEILRIYASHAPMGGNVVGVDAASWRYFGHDAENLSWAEAATLAVLPNSPAMMHFGKNRDKLLSKRNRLLKRLWENGTLNEVDYELAISEPLPPHPLSLPQEAPHLVDRIAKDKKGQHVTTTIDIYRQSQVEDIMERWNREFSQNGVKNIAAIILDIETNEVVSYCGNVYYDKNISGNQVDVIQSPRSTGSILKPFLYCAMLQEGQLLPNQLLADVPVNYNGFAPRNFSLQYDGATPASEALARSLNIPFVVSLRKYGVQKFQGLLHDAGMTTLTRSADNYGLSLILGGAEGKLWDVSCMYLQMAQLLNDYNHEGEYYTHRQPRYILSQNEEGIEPNARPLFSAGAIWHTFEALTNVNRPEEIDWKAIPSMQKIAWKTGTSFGARDGWAVGLNSKYVVGVWVGNSDGEGRSGLTGARTSGLVMFDIFNSLPHSRWYQQPTSDLRPVLVCRESGMLKSINCPDSSIDTLLVCKKGVDADVCPYHRIVHLSEDMKYQVFEDCAGARGIMHTSWFVLPPLWENFYRERHPAYKTLPAYSPECQRDDNAKLMEFIYPFSNTIINMPKQLDGTEGQVVFELAHRSPRNKVFWHLDREYIGETKDFHKKEYKPTRGEHRLTVVDETGASVTVKFTVN